MKWWGCQIALGWVIGAPLCLTAAETTGFQGRRIPPEPAPATHWVGTAGCALRGCHNGAVQGKGSEYRLWSTAERHSRAFDVLLDSRSQQIAQAIGLNQSAHESELCLKCHSTDVPSTSSSHSLRLSEGVSCEACHGAASQWLEPHMRHEWRSQSRSYKSQFGLRDLSSPRARVETCMNCHVGTPGFEVTHDMIAAGHPRLLFEATAFLDPAITRHWNEARARRRDPQFAAKLWLIGQTATLKRTLVNLEARSPEGLVTEFADHDCYACHKSLVGRSSADPLGATSRTWGRWPAELTLLAEKRSLGLPQGATADVAQLRDTLQLTKTDGSALHIHALSQKLANWDALADQAEWSPSQIRAIMLDCAAPIAAGKSDWEVAWQRYRALTALSESWSAGQESLATSLADLKLDLRMPRGFSSPKGFNLEAFNRHLDVVRKALESSP